MSGHVPADLVADYLYELERHNLSGDEFLGSEVVRAEARLRTALAAVGHTVADEDRCLQKAGVL